MLRGREVSRIEGFTDAVFGFALTLLVVSLEVPENFADLRAILSGFPAFAVTFSVICWIWYEHYLLFRKYDLEDGFTVFLNCVLLFLVVFYTYPLKFVFTRLISGTIVGIGPAIQAGMTDADGRMLMIAYSAGFVALFTTLMLLHWNALRQRARLNLGPLEIYDAWASVKRNGISVSVGLVSLAIAAFLPPDYLPLAGLIFFVMGPAHGMFGYLNGRAREKLESV